MPAHKLTYEQRVKAFWQKVSIDSDGCWRWKGQITNSGYALASLHRPCEMASRICFELLGYAHLLDAANNVFQWCGTTGCVNPQHYYLRTTEMLFWAKVQKKEDGCWEWTGYRDKDGYGTMGGGCNGRSPIRTHRFSYELHCGIIPDGLCVCHTCDHPWCVAPFHFFLGTKKENVDDMVRKGRQCKGDDVWTHKHKERAFRGSRHGMAKLTEDLALQIRQRHDAGEKQNAIATALGLSTSIVNRVVLRKTWTHI